jgi:hypothetical protein
MVKLNVTTQDIALENGRETRCGEDKSLVVRFSRLCPIWNGADLRNMLLGKLGPSTSAMGGGPPTSSTSATLIVRCVCAVPEDDVGSFAPFPSRFSLGLFFIGYC